MMITGPPPKFYGTRERTTVAGVTKNGVLPAQDRDLVAYN